MENSREKLRAFLCVDLPAQAKESISSLDKQFHSKLRFVSEDNMHVTLLFLGDIGQKELVATRSAMDKLDHGAFNFSIKGIGAFASSRPRVVFAKIDEGAEEFKDVYNQLSAGLKAAGIRTDARSFVPHVTIARVKTIDDKKELTKFVKYNENTAFGNWVCSEIKLKRSVLTQSGPVYSELYVRSL